MTGGPLYSTPTLWAAVPTARPAQPRRQCSCVAVKTGESSPGGCVVVQEGRLAQMDGKRV